MKFKLIIAIVANEITQAVIETARGSGATGCTVVTSARGEGLTPVKTFLGLTLEGQRDIVLLLVESHLSRHILEQIAKAGEFEARPGIGVAVQVDIEDAIGLGSQIKTIQREIESKL